MGAKIESAIRKELFEHYQSLSFGFYDQQRVGQLMSRISNDLFSLSELYHHGPEDLAIAVLKFSGSLFILFRLDVPLTLLIVSLTPFAAAYALYFNGRMNLALRQSKERIAAINERVEDSLLGIRVVKSFANEALEVSRFDDENDRFLATRRFSYRAEAFFSVGLAIFAQLITVAVIVIGAMRIIGASLGVADLMTYLCGHSHRSHRAGGQLRAELAGGHDRLPPVHGYPGGGARHPRRRGGERDRGRQGRDLVPERQLQLSRQSPPRPR
jgi:ATP-binding cassette subfamily B protein